MLEIQCSLVAAFKPSIIQSFFFNLAAAQLGSYLPDQGCNLCTLQWKCEVLTTRGILSSFNLYLLHEV